jgi:hypothetical protein
MTPTGSSRASSACLTGPRRPPQHAHVDVREGLSGVQAHAVDPGHTATNLNGHRGRKTVEQGTEIIVEAASRGPDGCTNSFPGPSWRGAVVKGRRGSAASRDDGWPEIETGNVSFSTDQGPAGVVIGPPGESGLNLRTVTEVAARSGFRPRRGCVRGRRRTPRARSSGEEVRCRSPVDYLVPGLIALCAGFGAGTTAVAVATDMSNGIVDRIRSMPVFGSSLLVGHVLASVARNLPATTLVIGIGRPADRPRGDRRRSLLLRDPGDLSLRRRAALPREGLTPIAMSPAPTPLPGSSGGPVWPLPTTCARLAAG